MKTISIQCPDQLHEELLSFVREGWVKGAEEAVLEALRRFLDSHRPDLQRMQVMKDVEWGLHGRD